MSHCSTTISLPAGSLDLRRRLHGGGRRRARGFARRGKPSRRRSSRIAVVGYSQGAATALELASWRIAEIFAAPGTPRPRAAAGSIPPAPISTADRANCRPSSSSARSTTSPRPPIVGDWRKRAGRQPRRASRRPPRLRRSRVHRRQARARHVARYDRAAARRRTDDCAAFLRERLAPCAGRRRRYRRPRDVASRPSTESQGRRW